MPAQKVIQREFLELRAKILELAASLDRIDRGAGEPDSQSMDRIHQGLEILLQPAPNRAEKVQLLFSRDYSQNWRNDFGI